MFHFWSFLRYDYQKREEEQYVPIGKTWFIPEFCRHRMEFILGPCVCVCPYCWYSFRISLRDCPFQLICTSMDLAEFLFTFSSSWACSPGLLSDGHSCVTLFAEIPQGPLSFHPSICRVHLLSVFALCLPSAAHYHIDTQSPGGDPWSQQSWGPRPLRYAVIENSNSPYNCQT